MKKSHRRPGSGRYRSRQLLSAVLGLAIGVLACDYGGYLGAQPTSRHALIQSINVQPESGTGKFTLAVFHDPVSGIASIACDYRDPKTRARVATIGTIESTNVSPHLFDFNLTQPGTYRVVCVVQHSHNDVDGTSVETSFTVTPAAADQTQTVAPMTSAELVIQLAQSTSNNPRRQSPDAVCFPPSSYADPGGYLHVSATGALEGKCAASKFGYTATLTGQSSPTDNKVAFHIDQMQLTVSPSGNTKTTVTQTYDGQGTFTTPTEASGAIQWTESCQAVVLKGQTADAACGFADKISGTVPFTMTLRP